MVLNANSFQEIVSDHSSSSAVFNLRRGTAKVTYLLSVNMTEVPGYDEANANANSQVEPVDLLSLSQVILGNVSTAVGDGRLSRLLPLPHPQWPWLYAVNYDVRGIGAPVSFPSISPLEAALPLPAFALYPQYEITIDFENRDYAVLADEDIEKLTWTWADEDGLPQTTSIATEWLRFTSYQTQPQNDWVTATVGNGLLFQTFSTITEHDGNKATDPGAGGRAPFTTYPRTLLPNEIIKMTWHYVPYRYYSSPNSYLRRFRGKINQFSWYDWYEGELLYLSANPLRFTPPLLQADYWLNGAITVEKWCDIELFFLATKRDGVNVPTDMVNPNAVAAGHNLLPWHGDNQFYYAQNPNTEMPYFQSFPVELLFTDPDAGIGTIGDAGAPDVPNPADVNPNA